MMDDAIIQKLPFLRETQEKSPEAYGKSSAKTMHLQCLVAYLSILCLFIRGNIMTRTIA